ncbi:Meiosis inhibitor protein 1 [Labeo rohita]|uniref:Meiosis inhibitor protein 1 n=1 Tax=Labeo rohita TaxID=84645 RepID=A0ABQ8MW35_LABRO|nr:Meiosis inhibitor protein 1 [Labeo rohita]
MVSTALNCLKSLMGFLHRRIPETAQHMVCQPWIRFLLFSLLSCDQRLRSAALQLLTLLVCFSGSVSQWRTEVESVMRMESIQESLKHLPRSESSSRHMLYP